MEYFLLATPKLGVNVITIRQDVVSKKLECSVKLKNYSTLTHKRVQLFTKKGCTALLTLTPVCFHCQLNVRPIDFAVYFRSDKPLSTLLLAYNRPLLLTTNEVKHYSIQDTVTAKVRYPMGGINPGPFGCEASAIIARPGVNSIKHFHPEFP